MNSHHIAPLFLLAIPLVVAPLPSQKPSLETKPLSKEDLEKRYKRETDLAYVRIGGWELDYDRARERARKEDRLIFAYFTRSDIYNMACKKLQDRLISDFQMSSFTKTVVPFLHVTTRIPGRKNDDLHAKKGFSKFPAFCFMDAKGEILYRLSSTDLTLSGFMRTRDNTKQLQALTRQAVNNTEAGKKLLFLRLKMQVIAFEQAQSQANKLNLTKAERGEFNDLLIAGISRMPLADARKVAKLNLNTKQQELAEAALNDLEVRTAMAPLLRSFEAGDVPPYQICYDLYKEGIVPTTKSDISGMFWSAVANKACDKSDVKALATALKSMREGSASANKAYLSILDRRLAELKRVQDGKPVVDKVTSRPTGGN